MTYQYTWEPNNWSKYYSEAPEIHAYFKGIVDKYNLLKYIKLRHRIDHAEWNDETSKWRIKITNLADNSTREEECDVFVNGGGILKYLANLFDRVSTGANKATVIGSGLT